MLRQPHHLQHLPVTCALPRLTFRLPFRQRSSSIRRLLRPRLRQADDGTPSWIQAAHVRGAAPRSARAHWCNAPSTSSNMPSNSRSSGTVTRSTFAGSCGRPNGDSTYATFTMRHDDGEQHGQRNEAHARGQANGHGQEHTADVLRAAGDGAESHEVEHAHDGDARAKVAVDQGDNHLHDQRQQRQASPRSSSSSCAETCRCTPRPRPAQWTPRST